MTTGYDRVSTALDNLRREFRTEGPPRRNKMLSAKIGRDTHLDEISLGLDSTGLVHLLTQLPEERERFPSPVGGPLRSDWIQLQRTDGSVDQALDIVCLDARIMPTLISLIGEMLDRMNQTNRAAIDELQEVMASWRRTLARMQARVSGETVRGLFGELIIAERLAQLSPESVRAVWKGPFSGRHDFAAGNAVEVKTYTSGGLPIVSISGLDQLDPPHEGSLHLVALRVTETANGRSIDEVAQSILDLGVEREFLTRAFNELGFQLGEAPETKLAVEEERLYAVGPDFPGLRRSRFSPEELRGLDGVDYRLNLEEAPSSLPFEDLDAVLRGLVD